MDKENKREENITAMKNKKGELETNIEEIKEIFKNFHTDLFKPNKKENTQEEKEAEEIQNIMFEGIRHLAKLEADQSEINIQEIEQNIKKNEKEKHL